MSDELLETTKEAAKAVQEASKTAGKAIDGASGIAEFGKQVFGDIVTDGVGLLSDKLKFYRLERFHLLREKTLARLAERGIDASSTVPVPPKIGVPLIEGATIEEDDTLHSIWADLLANAMDPDSSNLINHVHVSILKELMPLDASILNAIGSEKFFQYKGKKYKEVLFDKNKITSVFNSDADTIDRSLMNLLRLGCIQPGVVSGGINIGSHPVSSYKGVEQFHISSLGASLFIAIQHDKSLPIEEATALSDQPAPP